MRRGVATFLITGFIFVTITLCYIGYHNSRAELRVLRLKLISQEILREEVSSCNEEVLNMKNKNEEHQAWVYFYYKEAKRAKMELVTKKEVKQE
jgi:hypothetical protein